MSKYAKKRDNNIRIDPRTTMVRGSDIRDYIQRNREILYPVITHMSPLGTKPSVSPLPRRNILERKQPKKGGDNMAGKKRLDPETIKTVYLLHKRGMDVADISLRTGVSESVVDSTIKLVKKYWSPTLKPERSNAYLTAAGLIRVHYLNEGRAKRDENRALKRESKLKGFSTEFVEEDLLKDPVNGYSSSEDRYEPTKTKRSYVNHEESVAVDTGADAPVTVQKLIQQKVRAVEIALEDLLRVFGA